MPRVEEKKRRSNLAWGRNASVHGGSGRQRLPTIHDQDLYLLFGNAVFDSEPVKPCMVDLLSDTASVALISLTFVPR